MEASLCLEAAEKPQWPRVYSLDRTRSRDRMPSLVNPRRACAARVTVLGLCVCVSVTQHLTFHAIIYAINDTNFLSGG